MPQPIDLQTEAGRVAAAERVQQIADRQSLAAMQRSAAEVEDERVEVETAVQQAQQKSEQVDRELRRRNPYVGRRRRKKKDADADSERETASHGAETPSFEFYGSDERKETPENPEDHQLDVSI